jgi:NAD(P)H-hydrate repair Nnr-like enzyme with NAD(P)H-hydrate dehydratase domain
LVEAALGTGHALVLDAGALRVIATQGVERLAGHATMPILTPHEGEFTDLFGTLPGSKIERARAAAARSGGVVVYKGPDTVVAAPDGRAAILAIGSHWLASAGTGDVLAGTIAARRAAGLDAFAAACAGVWLQARAAELAGPFLIADDLVAHLPGAFACPRS